MSDPTKKKKLTRRIIRWFLGLLVILFLLLLLVIALQLPPVQTFVTNRLASVLTRETGAEISVERVVLRLTGSLAVKGLYAATQHGDTLLYAGELRAWIKPVPLLKRQIIIKQVRLSDAMVNIASSGQDEGPGVRLVLRELLVTPGIIEPGNGRYHIRKLLLVQPRLTLFVADQQQETPDAETSEFSLPDLDIAVGLFEAKQVEITIIDQHAGRQSNFGMDIRLTDLFMQHDTLGLKLNALEGHINEHITVRQASAEIYAGRGIHIHDLRVETLQSSIHAELTSSAGLTGFDWHTLEEDYFDLLLKELTIGSDLATVVTDDQTLHHLFEEGRQLSLTARLNGFLREISLEHFHLLYEDLLEVQTSGVISGLPQVNETFLHLPSVHCKAFGDLWSHPVRSGCRQGGSGPAAGLPFSGDAENEWATDESCNQFRHTAAS